MNPKEAMSTLRTQMESSIIGQRDLIRQMVVGLLANGHLLLESLPGLAKTRAVKSMARNLDTQMRRIQFTPDLLPSDITGTEVLHQQGGQNVFQFQPGPIFGNVILADEINRAPAKVQAALLEAMEERQITVGGTTHKMPDLFIVMATQNPIEQEGTYPLPEAQLDRFLMKVLVDYPDTESEIGVLHPVAAGHGQVEHQHVGGLRANQRDGAGAVVCFADHFKTACALENMAQTVAHQRVVVGDQHAGHVCSSCVCAACAGMVTVNTKPSPCAV